MADDRRQKIDAFKAELLDELKDAYRFRAGPRNEWELQLMIEQANKTYHLFTSGWDLADPRVQEKVRLHLLSIEDIHNDGG